MIFHWETPKNSFPARLDVRLKLFLASAVLILVISHGGFLFPLLILLLSLGLTIALKVPRRTIILRLAEPVFIALVILLLKTFFTGSVPLFTLALPGFELVGFREGLMEGLVLAARVLAACSFVTLVSLSTPVTEILAGLSWFRLPSAFIEILSFAYRYLFVLLEDALVIYDSQKNRLGYGSVKNGIKSFAALIASLLIKGIDKSQKVTVAMIQRGYDGQIPLLKQKPLPGFQLFLSGLTLILLIFLWQI